LGLERGMRDPSTPFWLQAAITVAVLAGIIGYVWWQMRRYGGEEFSAVRVIGVACVAACSSLPFVAAWWWLAPKGTGCHNPLLLAAVFVPIAALEVWGFVLALRERKRKKIGVVFSPTSRGTE
jgi:cytochrome bd-type quinol oxidase subunit 2